ncbi:hypothetical protein EJV47_13025 [Hymenobacter gummosus]|uniref:Uncharacterized protein n=1 Tax=Hymenobacter gummosus TaxID=1776032 RepID=A0A431U2W7_9BACT|nr:hypothetical protein [Hymenobacter gummosus]RTQ49728.1 hypothetical protein EJV47_13025 [Hymenobacter gummosus]
MEIEVAGVKYALYTGEVHAIELDLRYGTPATSTAFVQLNVRKRIASGAYESCRLNLTFGGVTKAVVQEEFIGGTSYASIVLNKRPDNSYYFAIGTIGDTHNPAYDYDNLVLVAQNLTLHEE